MFGVSLASQAYTAGGLLMEDQVAGDVIPATSGVTQTTILGIGTKTYTEGGVNALLQYEPLVTAAVYCVVDCANVTAANQLHKTHLMSTNLLVNNTSTTQSAGVFHALGIVGAIGGTKLYGYFIKAA
jgi:hypothetical protein